MTSLILFIALAVPGAQAASQDRSMPAEKTDATTRPSLHDAPQRPAASGPDRPDGVCEGFLAVLVPRQSVVLGAPREGVLATIDAALGRAVKAGTVLATLETESLERDLLAARVALREAEGELRKSDIYLAKSQDLCERIAARAGAFTEAERKDAEFNHRVVIEEQRIVTLRIEQRQLEIRRLEHLIRNSQVVAPIDGAIATRYLDAGATLAHAAPIVRMISNDLIVRFAAPTDRYEAVAPGTRVRFAGPASTTFLNGIVENVAREVDPALQMVVVEASICRTSGAQPRPGAEGRVFLVPDSEGPNALERGAPAGHSGRADPPPATQSSRHVLPARP